MAKVCDTIEEKKICMDSSVEGVCQLVTEGYSIRRACQDIADMWNKHHPTEEPVHWEAIRYEYKKANKPAPKPAAKKKTKKTTQPLPMADAVSKDEYSKVVEENATLKLRVAELTKIIEEFADKEAAAVSNSTTTIEQPKRVVRVNAVTRMRAFEYVKDNGNDIQVMAVRADTVTNARLLDLLIKVREEQLLSMPPSAIPAEILNATEII